ncbi:MAG: hypothetical protein CMJ80_13190 [Planctomycetaceae bacterium]|nr:hypothetical protein [Planctomycetaceae bacterium]
MGQDLALKTRQGLVTARSPQKIHDRLNLPDADEGIDLIAQTDTGEYWTIQSKYTSDENASLTRAELSTFTDLAFGICRQIRLGLVCPPTNRISYKLQLYENRLSFVQGDTWRSLDEGFFRNVRSRLRGKSNRIKPLRHRPHQKQAIKNVISHFLDERNSRGKLV